MTGEAGERISCATYTHARRHPMVLGQIGGWTPPFQLTAAQIVVLLVSVVLETQTWRWWGARLPPVLGVAAAVGVPFFLTWAVRRGRLEGRSLARTGMGWLALGLRPRLGRVGGQPYRQGRPVALGHVRVFVGIGDLAGDGAEGAP